MAFQYKNAMSGRFHRLVLELASAEAELVQAMADLEKQLAAVRGARAALANSTASAQVEMPLKTDEVATPPTTTTRPTSYTQRVYDAIVATPGIHNAALAATVYGESTAEAYHKVRSLVHQLKKSGRVRNTDRGRWEAVREAS